MLYDKESDLMKLDDEDELQFLDMDEPKPRNTYDAASQPYGSTTSGYYPEVTEQQFQPRNTCPESG